MSNRIEISRGVEKWGESAKGGFQFLPDILFKKQTELGLSPTDMLVLMNITMHWWYATQRPFPRPTTIAKRMGVDKRTVQRSLKQLSTLGLVARVTEKDENGVDRLVCDLSGLTAKLNELVVMDRDYVIRKERQGENFDEEGAPS